jgi:hypothetical protein
VSTAAQQEDSMDVDGAEQVSYTSFCTLCNVLSRNSLTRYFTTVSREHPIRTSTSKLAFSTYLAIRAWFQPRQENGNSSSGKLSSSCRLNLESRRRINKDSIHRTSRSRR